MALKLQYNVKRKPFKRCSSFKKILSSMKWLDLKEKLNLRKTNHFLLIFADLFLADVLIFLLVLGIKVSIMSSTGIFLLNMWRSVLV